MKPSYVCLAAIGLVGGLWVIGACVGHPTTTPESPITVSPELRVRDAAASEFASQAAAQIATPALIGSLRSRNHTIHLYVDRFTVEDSDGQILVNLVTEDEFARLLPGLFGDFKQMYAEGRLIADNHMYGKLPGGWSYSSVRTTRQRVKVISDP